MHFTTSKDFPNSSTLALTSSAAISAETVTEPRFAPRARVVFTNSVMFSRASSDPALAPELTARMSMQFGSAAWQRLWLGCAAEGVNWLENH